MLHFLRRTQYFEANNYAWKASYGMVSIEYGYIFKSHERWAVEWRIEAPGESIRMRWVENNILADFDKEGGYKSRLPWLFFLFQF